jgi:hypothetical protein
MYYNLILRTADGALLAFIATYENLDFAYKESSIGECVLQTNTSLFDRAFLAKDNILEIWRTTVSGSTYLEGERVWYLVHWRFVQMGASDILGIQMIFTDANNALVRRIIAYAAETAYARKTARCDDMMKAVVRENHGALAVIPARSIATYLQVQADLALSPSITKGFAWANVMDQFTEIANASYTSGAYLSFDTVYISPGLNEFRTYHLCRGIDHGSASGDVREISVANGSLANAVLDVDYSQVENHMYVGGEGREDAREMVEVSDAASEGASVINRCEGFVNASGSFRATADLTSEGQAALAEKRGRAVFDGNVVDTPGMQYGINYGYGDIVMAVFAGYTIDCHIDTVHITSAGGNETLDIKLHGEMPL